MSRPLVAEALSLFVNKIVERTNYLKLLREIILQIIIVYRMDTCKCESHIHVILFTPPKIKWIKRWINIKLAYILHSDVKLINLLALLNFCEWKTTVTPTWKAQFVSFVSVTLYLFVFLIVIWLFVILLLTIYLNFNVYVY